LGLMQRVVVLAVVAGLILITSLAVAIGVPRYACSENARLFEVPEKWPQDDEFGCGEIQPSGLTPGWYPADDRSPVKVWVAAGGLLIGGLVGASAFVSAARCRRRAIIAP
jgi:hypothetical protein